MASKYEIASYLVTLHSLMEAQTKGQNSVASSVLAQEYEKHWQMLKDVINGEKTKEPENGV